MVVQRRAMGPTGRVSSGGGYDGLDWIQVSNGHPESITPPPPDALPPSPTGLPCH